MNLLADVCVKVDLVLRQVRQYLGRYIVAHYNRIADFALQLDVLVVQALRDLLKRIRSVVLVVFALVCLLDNGQVDSRYFRLDELEFRVELGHDVNSALVQVYPVLRIVVLRGHYLLRVLDYVFKIHLAGERDPF